MSEYIAVLIPAVPATLAALAAWRASRQTKTSNGHRMGELLELHTLKVDTQVERLEQGQDRLEGKVEDLQEGQDALWEAVGLTKAEAIREATGGDPARGS